MVSVERRIGGERRGEDRGYPHRWVITSMAARGNGPDRRAPDSPAQGEGRTLRTPETDFIDGDLDCTPVWSIQRRRLLAHARFLEDRLHGAASSLTAATKEVERLRKAVIEECARLCDAEVLRIQENAVELRKYEWEKDEARARELGACYVREMAASIRALTSTAPKDKDGAATPIPATPEQQAAVRPIE